MAGSKLDTVISSTITYVENPPTQWIVLSSSATLVVGRAPSHGKHGPIYLQQWGSDWKTCSRCTSYCVFVVLRLPIYHCRRWHWPYHDHTAIAKLVCLLFAYDCHCLKWIYNLSREQKTEAWISGLCRAGRRFIVRLCTKRALRKGRLC